MPDRILRLDHLVYAVPDLARGGVMGEPLVETARAFARALDADDYTAARALLAPDCAYHTGREVLHGPEAILASYREASRWARASFDRVGYQSAVEEAGDRAVTVRFVDLLERRGLSHRHECVQQLCFGPDGRIARIVHRDLPGQAEALREYLRCCGIER